MSTAIPAGYKQTEVGVIPKDWEVKQITDVCDFIVPGRNKPQFSNDTIPWITTPDLEDGGEVFDSRLGLSVSRMEANRVGSRVVPAGSVVMSCVGELGITAYARCDIVINQQLHAFIPSRLIDGLFLLHAIKTRKGYLEGIATKTALPYLNKENCNSIRLPFPPLPEQRAIAAALSDVDALLAKLDQLIAKKRDLKQAAMQQLLTGQTRLPGYSGEWEVRLLGEIAHVKTGTKNNDDKVEGGEYPLFVRSQTVERINSYSYDCEAILVPGEGGIGSIFHYINGKFDCHQRVYKISTFSADSCGKFVFFCMKHLFHKQATRNSVKATVDSLRLPTFLSFEFLTPALKEQTAIVKTLNDMDTELAALEARATKTRALKQGMMQELLTGRIRLV